jgi:hypothetical protein
VVTALNRQFPHLRPDEIAIWQRFLEKFPDRFQKLTYDVRVGPGIALPSGTSEEIQKMAVGLSQKRIDVVAESTEGLTLVEISPNAGANSLGQLLVYRELWLSDHPEASNPRLLLVTGHLRSDIPVIAGGMGVEVVAV